VFTIGEFSKVTGLTVKTLRFYHEEGLLEPTCVDEQSGYRYYDASKVEAARVISFLRSLEFPVAEIRDLLRGNEAELTDALERQRKVIEERMKKLRQVAQSLDQFLASEKELKMLTAQKSFVCEEKTVEPMLIAAVRMKAPYADCGQGFAKIGKQFWNQICGPALLLCYDQEYQEIADFEACMPIKKGKKPSQALTSASFRAASASRCSTKGPTPSSPAPTPTS